MTTLDATEARSRLHNLIDETAQTHRPILITGKRGNAVLLAEEDWNAINEHCTSFPYPGMREFDPRRHGIKSRRLRQRA